MLPRIGVFGTNSMAKLLVTIYQKAGFEVTSICGRTAEKAGSVADELKIPFSTTKLDEILLRSDVDLVVVIAPPTLHAEISVKALNVGKHVITQNPPGLNFSDAEKMVTAARYYPTLLSALDNRLRFLPAVLKMREMVEDGYCGEIFLAEARYYRPPYIRKGYLYSWLCDDSAGGGALSLGGSQMIDILAFVMQQKGVEVNGFLQTFVRETSRIQGFRYITSDDFCTFQMKCSKGACATVTINCQVQSLYQIEIMVIGTKGRLVVRNSELYGLLNEEKREKLIVKEDKNLGLTGLDEPELLKRVSLPFLRSAVLSTLALKSAFSKQDDRMMLDPTAVKMMASFEDGMYVQAVVDAVRESSRQKKWTKVIVADQTRAVNPFWTAPDRVERSSPLMMHRAAVQGH
ncbi:glucose-fructose oxidoreductase domain-containing protein 2-like [Corticium candelabrum]|uniref:glucose-fructose oxidoreductase domain-containing protein 2-like n=1 Tax=Corticium candelabrum TaxID=121492 RepID=UPI002E276229|nr:glucose-fructose oxidoreductase domain-containing protein 2-like [Corticium candelabrum]